MRCPVSALEAALADADEDGSAQGLGAALGVEEEESLLEGGAGNDALCVHVIVCDTYTFVFFLMRTRDCV